MRKFASTNNNLLTPDNPNEIHFGKQVFKEFTYLIAMHAARKFHLRHPTTYRQCRHLNISTSASPTPHADQARRPDYLCCVSHDHAASR
jgi:hypothetical protein